MPVARSTLFTDHGLRSYQAQHGRLAGRSETYEVARMVVRNRLLGTNMTVNRKVYFLLLVFPRDYELTNNVFSPGSQMGAIEPQITPVEVSNQISGTRVVLGLELDIAFALSIVESEPRTMIANTDTLHAQELDDALQGMVFSNP